MKWMATLSTWTMHLAKDDSDGCPLPRWFERTDKEEPTDDGPKRPALDGLKESIGKPELPVKEAGSEGT